MPDEVKTCQVHRYNGEPCGRPCLLDDDKCICHSKDPDKDPVSFQSEVDEQLNRTDTHDFSWFVFPCFIVLEGKEFKGTADFTAALFTGNASFIRTTFREVVFTAATFAGSAFFAEAEFTAEARFVEAEFKWANFGGAKFLASAAFREAKFAGANFASAIFTGDVDFSRATFKSDADFSHAEFWGEAEFRPATFAGYTNFYDATFKSAAYFSGATFKSDAHFIAATFKGRTDFAFCHLTDKARLRFENERFEGDGEPMFGGDTFFRYLDIEQAARLIFCKVSLDKCRFLETDLTRVEFHRVQWAQCQTWLSRFVSGPLRSTRAAVFDEIAPDSRDEHELVAEVYRRLQANLISNYRYFEAGDFHIGEQEMIRRSRKSFSRCRVASLYRWVSHYGESFLRPLFWLAFTLTLFPILLLYSGICPSSDCTRQNQINYDWVGLDGNIFLFNGDYWNAFWMNLSFVTWNRSAISTHLPEWYQRGMVTVESLLLIVLVTFFVLALRRQFKRKSF